ncbi:endonuclease/exonuclease/phosphatase family metal-dependent hydrolase [Rhizobium sp. BK313]|uniref:endonuclease/exonuclease/phosphatase family protein n=1 Tax=Rhizobium sp. BK313 TaxID=2587081 RepID=UPI001060B5C2|nr:endonuclease/exonuclease/phosphatase family protein [Rhizobium sp. BK313]MBB3457316.1 endonuclease/exonuclease/phosphatase family metal-dependent hydrolase [Rhizobium sp. BK313]
MNDWIALPTVEQVSELTVVSRDERERLRDGPVDAATFAAAFDSIPALRQIEIGGNGPRRTPPRTSLRVASWNVGRLRHLQAIGDTLAQLAPDVTLLTEIDKGMARSGNGHRIAELAARLGQGYAYGVEFIELDRGDPEERAMHAHEIDLLGFHGNGIITDLVLSRPFLVRLEAEGKWFGWEREEPRIGGRMAIGGQIELDGTKVTLVAVHFESHSDPEHRASQAAHLLDVIDRYDPVAPVLIGGDFNTSTFSWGTKSHDAASVAAALAADPRRRVDVEPYEPLFALMARRRYDWIRCNVPGVPTERPDEPTDRVLGKIDWFFSRGLKASLPAVISALKADGTPSSDHDCLMVEIGLA